MFERFTDRARRVVVLAQEEARGLSHNYIGTEHILLGVLSVGEGLGAQALDASGIRLEPMRDAVEAEIGRGASAPKGHIPFTPRAKRSLELALREALKLGHNYIGTEHVLLGILREGKGVAVKLLEENAESLDEIRKQILALMSNFTARAVGGEDVYLAARAAEEMLKEGKEPPGTAEIAAPLCPSCRGDLESSAAYRIGEVPEHNGEGRASVLFVFCRTCGHTFDSLIAPNDA
jgi:ATP-dependent Clp protease ATP-binding subunit ClpC